VLRAGVVPGKAIQGSSKNGDANDKIEIKSHPFFNFLVSVVNIFELSLVMTWSRKMMNPWRNDNAIYG
jgi:hypothetical protein